MTKPNFTSINILLDGSGSMERLTNDTIGGVNKFLTDQKALPGEAALSIHVFNTKLTPVYDFVPLSNVHPLTKKKYSTHGGTALLDAMGQSIDNLGTKLSFMKEEDRPSKVLFLIITDGEENASNLTIEDETVIILQSGDKITKFADAKTRLKYPLSRIKEMVSHQRGQYNWEFAFMGANIDAFADAAAMGMAKGSTLNYTASAAGTADLYANVSQSVTNYRNSGSTNNGGFFNNP